jgi:UDP-glucose 4-epimerase
VDHDSQILITGGAGFIGSALANRLLAEGYKHVTCMDNLSSGTWDRVDVRAKKLEIDLSKITVEQLRSYLNGTEIIFHLAAVKLHNSKNSFNEIVANNVIATNTVLEAAGLSGIKKFVFSSSLYVYGLPQVPEIYETLNLNPLTIYGTSKVMGESMVQIRANEYGFDFGIARLFFIYGHNQYSEGGYKSVIVNNFERIRQKLPSFINGDGRQVLDYLHVNDCISALMLIAKNPSNDVFNVASNQPTSIVDLVQRMSEVTNFYEVEHRDSDWTAGTYRVGSNEKLSKLLGWNPEIDLLAGLAMTWETIK